MRKEDFVALGIADDLAEKAASASAEELKGFVPKARYNEEAQKRKNVEGSYESVKSELDKLKASAGNNEDLQKKIDSLQAELEDKDKKYADEIKEMKMANAIRSAIGSTAQDADLVAGLIDKSKLILSDDDKLTGIDEQIKTIKESKPFLFKDSNDPSVDDNGEVTPPGGKRNTRDQFADWLNQY